MRKAPPPFSPATYGNFHILPKPMALPAAAKITPALVLNPICLVGLFFMARSLFYDIEQADETGHHEDLTDVGVDSAHLQFAAFGSGLFAESEEQTQTR